MILLNNPLKIFDILDKKESIQKHYNYIPFF
jgi:hypothetical protein